MNYADLFAKFGSADEHTRASLIGVGQFGRTLLMQSRRIPQLTLGVLCDLDIDRLKETCRSVGLDEDGYAVAETVAAAILAIEAGKIALTVDPDVAIEAPGDVIVEATGSAEAGTRNSLHAIEQGRHIALVTKETDSVVGPMIAARAARQGLVVSQVDGDQPSLLLGLVSWAQTLGLELVCAGKASEYDFVFDQGTQQASAEGVDLQVPLSDRLWNLDSGDLKASIGERSEVLAALPQRTPPDYCEMCLVANASGLKPDRPEFHAPVARVSELPDLFRTQQEGGLLSQTGRLDMFNCFRRPDEVSAAGGVFVVVRIPDEETGRLFGAKGMPTSRDRTHLLAYNPTHLLGVEAALSVIVPHRLGLPTGSSTVAPICDVAMRATKDLAAGTVLDDHGHHHHHVDGVEALLVDTAPIARSQALPYFMAMGCTLTKAVAQGEFISPSAVVQPEGSQLWSLRGEQDRHFA
ncbi:MAG: flagellar biosynthesis protein FlgA [Alphaproteobacteria bacterium]|nr:flagellar biosynthesis protein FlgA [Alphaproteobacteria bacterium]